MKIYGTLNTIPVYNFYKIVEENDVRYVIKNWRKKKKDIKIPEQAKISWDNIYDEYNKKTKNKELDTYLYLTNEVSHLETRYFFVSGLIHRLSEANKKEFGKELNAWGIKFNIEESIESQLDLLQAQVRASKNKYIRKNDELSELKGYKSNQKQTSLTKQKIELIHVTGVPINEYKMSMNEWLELIELANEIIKSKSKKQSA